jgi:hypothetical protein
MPSVLVPGAGLRRTLQSFRQTDLITDTARDISRRGDSPPRCPNAGSESLVDDPSVRRAGFGVDAGGMRESSTPELIAVIAHSVIHGDNDIIIHIQNLRQSTLISIVEIIEI